MELIGSIFLILALALIVGLFIARPFLTGFEIHASDAAQAREHQRSALLAERDRVLNALQELDFDNALGKIPAEEYPIQRATLLKAGADALRRLDEFDTALTGGQSTSAAEAALASRSRSAEDRIEAAVAARRADARQHATAAVALAGSGNGGSHTQRAEELENIIASRKRERKESAGGFCPNCGKPVSKSDKFCSRCGAVL